METRDTLLQYLVGINEEDSIRVINTQMTKLVSKLGAMRVKVEIDPNAAKQMASQVNEIVKSIDLRKNYIKSDNLFPTIEGEHNEAIRDAMETYREFGFALDRITRDAEGNLISFTGKAKDANGALKTLRFNAEGGVTGETLILNTEKQITSMLEKAKTAEKALATLQTRIVQSGGKPSQLSREAELLQQIDGLYAAAAVEVQNSDRVTEDYRQTLLNNIAIQKQAGETVLNIARQRAQADRVEADSFKEKENALKEYAAVLKRLNDIQLGKNTGYFEEDLTKNKLELEELIGTTSEYKVKLFEAREAAKEAFKVEELKQAKTEYDKLGGQVDALGIKLQKAQVNLDKAKLKGNQQDAIMYQLSIEKITQEMDALGIKAVELSEKLRIEDGGQIEKKINDFKELRQELEQTANISGALDDAFGKVVNTFRDGTAIGNVTRSTKELTVGVEELGKKLLGQSATVRKIDKDNTNFNQMTKKVTYSVKEANGQFKLYTYTLDKGLNSLRLTGVQTDTAAKKIEGFKNQVLDAAKKIGLWGVSTKLVYGTFQSFQKGIETVKELDKELTQIAVVQGTTRESVLHLGNEYANTAIKMAQTVQDVAKLNTELVRQGLSIEDAAERASIIMKLSSAGMVSMEQSLQVITTGVNALGVAQEKVADVILKASMLSASDVEGLGEAFSKTASGAKAAGLSIEETTSLLATMKDVTQEGDSQLGTSLKSMLARFNKINEETGDMNEDLNEVQTAIESVGVAFVESDGQIRNFYDIIEDLSGVWDGLDKNTKSYIATQAAGVRQQNRFFAVMDNFNKVQAINNDLTFTAGTLQSSYATYMTGTEAASQRLKSTLDKLWMGAINSDTLIGLYEMSTTVLKIVDHVGLLELALSSALSMYFIKKISKMEGGFNGLGEKIKSTTRAIKEFGYVQPAIKGAGDAAEAAGSGATVAGTGFKGMAASIGLTKTAVLGFAGAMAGAIAVSWAIGKAISWFTEQQAKAAKETARLMEITKELKDTLGSQNLDLFEMEENFNKLQDYRDRLSELNSSELKDYYDLNDALIDQYPELATQVDSMGKTVVSYTVKLENLNAEYSKLKDQKLEDFRRNIDKTTKETKKIVFEAEGLDKIQKQLNNLIYQDMSQADDAFYNTDKVGQVIKGKEDEYNQIIENNKGKFIKAGRELMSLMAIEIQAQGDELSPILLNALASPDLLQQIGVMWSKGLSFDEILNSQPINEVRNNLHGLALEVKGLDLPVRNLEKYFDTLHEEYQYGKLTLEEYRNKVNDVAASTTKLEGADKVYAEALRGMVALRQDEIDKLEKEIATEDELAEARKRTLDESASAYEKSGKAAMDYYKDLELLNDSKTTSTQIEDMILSKYPQWAYMMNDKAALSQAFQQAMMAEDEVRTESYINMLLNTESFVNATGGAYKTLMDGIREYYKGDITNYTQLESAKAQITENFINQLNKEWGEYFHQVNGYIKVNRKLVTDSMRMGATGFHGEGAAAQAQKFIDGQVSRLNKIANEQQGILDGITSKVDTFKASIKVPDFKTFAKDLSDIGKAGKSAGKGVDAAKKAAEEYNKAMKATQDATKEVFDFALEYINWIEEQKREEIEKTKDAAIEAAEAAYDTEIELIDKALEQQEEILDAKEAALKTEEETYEYQKKRLELQDSLVNLEYKLALASLDTSVSGAARRKTLMESLAEEQENLDELERDRKQTLQEEWFARQRAFIQNQAEIERAQAEATKTAKIEKAEQEYTQKNLKLDQYYSAELNYLAAVEATQSGMIENLNGKMIPLKEAFKELAIENERFWTFFGQQEVEEFGNTVTTVMEAIKKLGFETIQTWKEVATAATNASNAASSAASSAGGSSKYSGTPSTSPSTSSSQVNQPALNKQYQQWLKNLFASLKLTLPSGFDVDGIMGPATRSASTIAQNRKETNSAVDNVLRSVAQGNKVTDSMMETLRKNVTSTASGNTIKAYADGGKIDYTGPAQVHGSKSKPEYVFNYQQFKDLSKMIARHELTSVKKPTAITKPVEIKFDNLIKVEGSIDKDSLPQVKQVANDAIDKLANQLKGWGK